MNKKIRLFQIRKDPEMIVAEQQTFIERCKIEPEQLFSTNVVTDPLSVSLLDGMNAVFIGGAGAFSVTKDYSWTRDLIELVNKIYDRNIPLMGCCWGHQFIARALGGTVIHDSARHEMGRIYVDLTPAGEADPLFGGLDKIFPANAGHHDRVSILPDCAVALGHTEMSPNQVIKIKDKPIYGTQFHSELDAKTMKSRFFKYRDWYPELTDDAHFNDMVSNLTDTPETDDLLAKFLNLYVKKA